MLMMWVASVFACTGVHGTEVLVCWWTIHNEQNARWRMTPYTLRVNGPLGLSWLWCLRNAGLSRLVTSMIWLGRVHSDCRAPLPSWAWREFVSWSFISCISVFLALRGGHGGGGGGHCWYWQWSPVLAGSPPSGPYARTRSWSHINPAGF